MDIRTLFPEVKRLLDRTPVEDISSVLSIYLYDTGWLPEDTMYYHPLFGLYRISYSIYDGENSIRFTQVDNERTLTVYGSHNNS